TLVEQLVAAARRCQKTWRMCNWKITKERRQSLPRTCLGCCGGRFFLLLRLSLAQLVLGLSLLPLPGLGFQSASGFNLLFTLAFPLLFLLLALALLLRLPPHLLSSPFLIFPLPPLFLFSSSPFFLALLYKTLHLLLLTAGLRSVRGLHPLE
ncbi:hypothetical protein Vafri_7153, partial [Volvox africanus]